jgi:hypothetical protein
MATFRMCFYTTVGFFAPQDPNEIWGPVKFRSKMTLRFGTLRLLFDEEWHEIYSWQWHKRIVSWNKRKRQVKRLSLYTVSTPCLCLPLFLLLSQFVTYPWTFLPWHKIWPKKMNADAEIGGTFGKYIPCMRYFKGRWSFTSWPGTLWGRKSIPPGNLLSMYHHDPHTPACTSMGAVRWSRSTKVAYLS